MSDPSLKSRFIPRVISLIPFCLGVALIGTQSAKALTITPTSDAKTLVETITGSGITVDPTTIEFIGVEGSSGTFTNGISSGIGIDEGIILTTGKAVDAVGPNSEQPFPGTAHLSPTTEGRDTSSLKFQFESKGGDVFLEYVFASEEYSLLNSFFGDGSNNIDDLSMFPSDVFNIFVNGENIALIPETDIPVSVRTVNSIRASEFYNNNDPALRPLSKIEYDGYTTLLTAKVSGLAAGVHQFEAFISDGPDGNTFDSAVFIRAGSLTAEDHTYVPEPNSIFSLLGMAFIVSIALTQSKKVV